MESEKSPETRRGDLFWIYYHRVRRRWFLHGRVA